jgi:hypothetical protein
MALPTSPTLEDIRAAVLSRIGARANSDKRLVAFLNEEIRSAHTRLYIRHWWARRRLVVPIPLIEGRQRYDIPDQLTPQFEHVWIETDTGGTLEISQHVPTPVERDALLRGVDEDGNPIVSTPSCWWVEDDMLTLGPMPDTEVYPQLVVQGMERENPVVNDGHRIRLDRELLILHVVRAAQDTYGEDSTRTANTILEYEDDLRGDAAERETFSLGSQNGLSRNKAPLTDEGRGHNWRPANRLWMGGRGRRW